jgi:pimeloyl-ACP methyl ester carboxylesterase
VVEEPAIVSGLSSGGVLAVWLAAYAPDHVVAVIAEDPPMFSSIWPRIQDEKLMTRNFKLAVDILGKPGERDVEQYLSEMGVPVEGETELLKIPPFIVKGMFFLNQAHRLLHPNRPYDTPFLPFNMRAGHKFMSEYDTDFSRATIDGDLSKDFDPEEILRRVKCPMLLMRADASRHETWGLLGAIDDNDLVRIVSLVDDLKVVAVPGGHEIHMVQPKRYTHELIKFVDDLRAMGKLPPRS